ncbi:hypothetical protein HNQ61_001089 [Longimicrobium terrae]|uniref:Polymerase nucleotidyl transferase domain-containing protein n=2 Tax=Longimicrobium terrae TaxID=1639882 RepID=A0A841GVK1_9BACT|nr:hypothetical protein [Longimicrobium terrae]
MEATPFTLPDLPRDAHRAAAESVLGRLAARFPSAGLGVTGSVSTGTHTAESDLDLVVADASFRREMQFATRAEGVRTAILCLHPGFDAERERRWMLASGGDAAMVTMVRTAFVARDPAGWLAEMQRTVARLSGERHARRGELVALRRERALAAVRALAKGTEATDEQLQLELFAAVVEGWYLRKGLSMDSKRESARAIDVIAARDPELHQLLRRAIPITHGSMAPLLRAVDYVFEPAARDDP